MAVIATINRKGGCGKTTLVTHLAVSLAKRKLRVTVVDVDFQQSMNAWLKRRRARFASFEFAHGSTEFNSVQRPATDVGHTLVDSCGSVRGYELAKLLTGADLVLVPVCDSMFDYEASQDCIAEMRQHPRVAKGRVKLAVVGMRILAGSDAEQRARAWAARLKVPYLGSVRASALYGECASSGLTVFDLEQDDAAQAELADWRLLAASVDSLMSQHEDERALNKSRALRQGSIDSGFAESTFGPSGYGPLQRMTPQASLISRSPGVPRTPSDRSLIQRVLTSLPRWRSKGEIRPLL
jgi:chromosome partitioning protein